MLLTCPWWVSKLVYCNFTPAIHLISGWSLIIRQIRICGNLVRTQEFGGFRFCKNLSKPNWGWSVNLNTLKPLLLNIYWKKSSHPQVREFCEDVWSDKCSCWKWSLNFVAVFPHGTKILLLVLCCAEASAKDSFIYLDKDLFKTVKISG